jgi:hypothetical protein
MYIFGKEYEKTYQNIQNHISKKILYVGSKYTTTDKQRQTRNEQG